MPTQPVRGWLRKRVEEAGEKERVLVAEIARWNLAKPSKIPVLPEVKKKTQLDMRYPLLPPFAYARVHWDDTEKNLVYELEEPSLTAEEKNIYKRIEQALTKTLELELGKFKTVTAALDYLKAKTRDLIDEAGIELRPGQFTRLFYYIYRNFVGLNEIEPLMHDAYIEDLGVDGLNIPVYIVHKKYGEVKTSVRWADAASLHEFVIKLAERCGRYISYAEPMLDGSLPDGSRVQATLAKDVTRHGPTFSIRKFREIPYSTVDLIKLGTASSEMMAYMWYVIEHRKNILIVGGTATGKTTFLNSISIFIPPEEKIVSIEDTAELNLPHENWIPGVARIGFGTMTREGVRFGEVTMFDLLRESFRQNPDYVIVGEVRGKEASVLFQGMASGHSSFGTMHGGSVDDIIRRLQTPPLELPAGLLEILDVIIVITKTPQFGRAARRIKSVNELLGIDAATSKANFITYFQWSPVLDKHKRAEHSALLEEISADYGIPLKSIEDEIKLRVKYLDWLLRSGIVHFQDVSRYISLYYKDKEEALRLMEEGAAPPTASNIPLGNAAAGAAAQSQSLAAQVVQGAQGGGRNSRGGGQRGRSAAAVMRQRAKKR